MNLEDIRAKIINDPSNKQFKKLGYEPVYTASTEARIMIVGQAPGIKAQESHTAWNDPSGDKLRDWLGINKKVFYGPKVALIPMDFYFPGKDNHGDKPPRKDFASIWHPRLVSKMPDIKLTILAGQYAQKYYLGDRAERNLTETVRNYKNYLPDFLPLVHPSPLNIRWRSKNPWFEAEVVPAGRKLVHKILFEA